MNRTTRWSVLGATLVLAVTMVVGLVRARGAAGDAASARASLDGLIAESNEILALRANAPRVSFAEHDPAAVLSRVNELLIDAGVSSQCFEKLAPDSTTRATSGALRRQSMRLSLRSIALPELGQFFALWRDREPQWTPSRLEVTRRREDDRLDVAIVLSTWVLGGDR